jgi:hypothetical protein
MALLLIANLLSPWLVTPPPSYGAQGKIVAYKVRGIQSPDDLEPTLNTYGKEGWERVQLTPTGPLVLHKWLFGKYCGNESEEMGTWPPEILNGGGAVEPSAREFIEALIQIPDLAGAGRAAWSAGGVPSVL